MRLRDIAPGILVSLSLSSCHAGGKAISDEPLPDHVPPVEHRHVARIVSIPADADLVVEARDDNGAQALGFESAIEMKIAPR